MKQVTPQSNFFEKVFRQATIDKQINFISIADEKTVKHIYDAVNNDELIPREKNSPPDFYFETKDYVIGIEHFMIDCSKRNSKGSKLLQNKNFQELKFENEECIIQEAMDLNSLINSFEIEFNNHSNKIKKYKQLLSIDFPNKNIKIFFAIHFYNPFKMQFIDETKGIALDVFNFRKIVNNIHSCIELDGIIYTDHINTVYFSNNDENWKYFYSRGFYSIISNKINGVKLKPIEAIIKEGKITVDEKIELF